MDTPKHIEVIARGLALREGRVLFCRSVKGGYRYLPGGHVEPGESSAEALAREFREETGLAVRVGAFLLASEARFTQKGKARHELTLVFHVEHEAGEWPDPCPTLEDQIAFDWVDAGAVPEAGVLPPAIRAWLMAGGPGDDPDRHAEAWVSHAEPPHR